MTRKIARIIGIFMLFAAVIFIIVACNNPQMSFPWSNTVTYMIYIVWLVIMIIFIVAPFGTKNKISSSILAVVPLSLLQYFYWNWLIKELMNNTLRNGWFLLVSAMIALFYCMYEKFIVYAIVLVGTSFRDRMLPAVFWTVESLIATLFSYIIVHDYEMKYNYGMKSVLCLFAGVILIVSFLFCRTFLYRKKK